MTTTVWALNRAENFLDGRQDKLDQIFKAGTAPIYTRLGDRHTFNVSRFQANPRQDWKRQGQNNPIGLMSEENPNDEYFVPIPVKCIGHLFDARERKRVFLEVLGNDAGTRALKNVDQELLKGIQQNLRKRRQADYKKFWKEPSPLPVSRMVSKPHMGYYEMLMRCEKNILVGYSQGGLVARYLAFLDEYVFKLGVIDGVITIGAPNYGSPLANPDNADEIAKNLVKCVTAAGFIYNDPPATDFEPFFAALLKGVRLGSLMEIFDGFIESVEHRANRLIVEDGGISDEQRVRMEDDRYDLLVTLRSLRKWTGGATADANNAFRDLNLFNIESEPYSVLALVNHPDYALKRTAVGAVINADNQPPKISNLLRYGHWIARLFRQKIIEYTLQDLVFGHSLNDNLNEIWRIFTDEIHREQEPNSSHTTIRYIVKGHQGKPRHDEYRGRHDLVIPSMYQHVQDKYHAIHLGNFVNEYTNHYTGQIQKFKRGNDDTVWHLLRTMRGAILQHRS